MTTQQAIIANLEKLGYKIIDTSSVGGGFPDHIISKFGENILIIMNSDKLTDEQIDFIAKWNSAVYLILTAEDIRDLDNNRLTPISVSNFIKLKK